MWINTNCYITDFLRDNHNDHGKVEIRSVEQLLDFDCRYCHDFHNVIRAGRFRLAL